MRKYIGSVLSFLLVACAAFAQSTLPVTAAIGEVDASLYSSWSVHSVNSTAAGSATMTLDNCFPKVGQSSNIKTLFLFATNAPVTVSDGASTETVTPTSVTTPTANTASSVNPYNCSITATFTYAHSGGVTIGSGDNGLAEAINDASTLGLPVLLTAASGITNAQIVANTAVYPNVVLDDRRSGGSAQWTPQPSTLTALATPATRSAAAGTTQVISGTATGTWTAATTFVAVTYVDILGGESPASASFSFTATASVALNFASPAASTGAVGWRAYAGITGTSTMYQLPISSSTCTLSTLTPYPTCAVGAAGVFPTVLTTTALAPAAGGVAATYRPNTQSHTTFAYAPNPNPVAGFPTFQRTYGPFLISPALTAGQSIVMGTVPLPAGFLNYIGRTVRITGTATVTFSTQATVFNIITALGDTTDFSTGTPKTVCSTSEPTATGTVATKVYFQCMLTVNAIGATGSIMPSGFTLRQVTAAGTTGNVAVELATAAITADVLNQSTINLVLTQTGGAESTTPPQLQNLTIEVL